MLKTFSLYSLRKRIFAIGLAVSFLFCALCVRLFVLQILQGQSLQLRATDQWTRDLSIVAPRGTIYDSTGASLAVSYTTYNVYTRARQIEEPALTAKLLADALGLRFEDVYTKVRNKGQSEILIDSQVDADTAELIYSLKLEGVYLSENVSRYYPYGNLLTQLLGFVSSDNSGQSGVEAYYDSYLAGVNGYSYVQSDLLGTEIGGSLRYYVAGEKGDDITLTIDNNLQQILESALSSIMTEQLAKSASGMILSAKTGEVLAISSKPSFDLNEVPRDDLETLFSQSRLGLVTDSYEPGSTFKILTVAAALEEGLTSLDDTFYCPGYKIVDGVKIKCWKSVGHGSQTLAEAFANSCNCCFMELALRLGVDKFYEYMQKFGLGEKTGITVSGEASGILMDKSSVKNVDLARMGFGHAVAVTPIQLAMAVAAATSGTLVTPQIVSQISSSSSTQSFTTQTKRMVLSSSTVSTVNYLLSKATNKVADYTFVEGYDVGGKTGTAQKYGEDGTIAQGKYISSFIGTYPASNPEYIVMILVDEPSNGAYYGSIVAAPYGKQIFAQMFEYLGIEKDAPSAVAEYVIMPNITGLTLAEAAVELKKVGLFYELDGEGDIVTAQLPPAGSSVQVGSTVLVIT